MIKDCVQCDGPYVAAAATQLYCDDVCRFMSRVDVGDCWVWTGQLDGGGYGKFKIRGTTTSAHRWLYATLVGEIPAGLELDHLCFVKLCVNPDHLEPVTRAVNQARRRRYRPRGYAGVVSARRGPRATPLRLRWRLAT